MGKRRITAKEFYEWLVDVAARSSVEGHSKVGIQKRGEVV